MKFIGKNVEIDEEAFIGDNVYLFGPVKIERGVIIEEGCMIGKPSDSQYEQLKKKIKSPRSYNEFDEVVDTKTVIKKNCYIGHLSTIYSGTTLQEGVICKDYSLIGWDSTIGEKTKLMCRAQVYSWVMVGRGGRIGGLCGNDSKMGDNVSMFGYLLHSLREHGGGRRDPAPTIGDNVIVGMDSKIIGDISIGNNSYIAAGSIVTKNVPANTIVTFFNKQCHINDWKGKLRTKRDVK